MGAISFTIDRELLRELKRLLPLRLFVETGTFRGETLAVAQPLFDQCISIELSPEYHRAAQERLAGARNVRLIQGDSVAGLQEVSGEFSACPTLFWLDAHWCAAESAAGEKSQCPLVDELKAIGRLRPDSAVLIDDARYFLAPPPAPHDITTWPDLNQVLEALHALSPEHVPVTFNDVLMFVPRAIYPALRPFMHRAGVDLLTVADKSRDYDRLLAQLKEKDELIAEQKGKIERLNREGAELQSQLLSKEGMIADLQRVCEERDDLITLLSKDGPNKKWIIVPRRPSRLERKVTETKERVLERLARTAPNPLGLLAQHEPRPLRLPSLPRSQPHPDWPRICLVTPSYQQAPFLGQTIESVLSQGYPKLAYGVQDGGSTDGSAELIVRYLDRLYHAESAKDDGQADAIKRGFQKLFPENDDIMAWLNSDDLLCPGCLGFVGEYFRKHPEVDVIYGHRLIIDDDGMEIGRWYLPPHEIEPLRWVDFVPQETLFWRASAYRRAGGVDPNFHFAMDWDLLLRFQDVGCNIRRLPHFLGVFRVHTHQKTSAKISTLGEKEMQILRTRTHGRDVAQWEILKHYQAEVRRSAWTAWLHRRGIRL